MANLTILRTYALKNPETLPSSILFSHTAKSLTIYDAYPKSMFHFLILPRVQEPLTTTELGSLRSLLKINKERAKEVITGLHEDAKAAKKEIEEEMLRRYGFKWDVWTGFHGAPSMEHLHVHVLSADLCSEKMKNKKHYNSFHPSLGFFLHIDEVLSWFDAEPSFYAAKAQLKPSTYEPILKEDLSCFHCNSVMKNMPTLKAHLHEEWNKIEKKSKAAHHKKRKLESDTIDASDVQIGQKKSKPDSSE
ncbi:HIT-like domain-containing protein [Crucibulum laeve]|uniref:HIT-like domain-containing protein n=1 Tax=Crucibulum laeve TaxID=68775 RepID=A0A5C3MN93_9AGAR|nr:HIT-like domain-containing protein [Crucibulum laeve]